MDKSIRKIIMRGMDKARSKTSMTEEEEYIMSHSFLDLCGQTDAEEFAKAIHDKLLTK